VKVGGGNTTECGWSFNSPGTDCTATPPPVNQQNANCVPGLNVSESPAGTQTAITISWSDTNGMRLVDARVKCSNDCHIVLQNGNAGTCGGGTCSFGPSVGCP
jgi:hypothetical protein